MNPNLKTLSEKALSLPLSPGVYIMKGEGDKIIYIGKARELKNRVSQYFRKAGHESPKVQSMVDHVKDFDYIVCTGEFEALILEASLIKQHTPKYNILLKDDKGYHYIRISNDKWRNITAEKMIKDDGAKYLGPTIRDGWLIKRWRPPKIYFHFQNATKILMQNTNPVPVLITQSGFAAPLVRGRYLLPNIMNLLRGLSVLLRMATKKL